MSDWNEQAAPNNNLSSTTIRTSKIAGRQDNKQFSEELSDDGERNNNIKIQTLKHK